jgi:hypothetical protein
MRKSPAIIAASSSAQTAVRLSRANQFYPFNGLGRVFGQDVDLDQHGSDTPPGRIGLPFGGKDRPCAGIKGPDRQTGGRGHIGHEFRMASHFRSCRPRRPW